MKTWIVRCAVLAALALVPAVASAQHEGHQAPGQPAPAQGANPAQVAACVESQQQTSALVDAANARLEMARQTNQPSAMRSALADLQTTLSTIRIQLATCTQLQTAAGMPPGHNMANMPGMHVPGAPNASVTPSAAAAGTPAANSGSTQPAPAAPSAPAASATPKMVMVMTSMDPAKLQCPTKIDPDTAAKATYKGKTYYFCSTKERDEFLTNPEMSLSMRPPL